MDDSRVFQIRNVLFITFAVMAAAVMWSNVIGLAGTLSVIVHILLFVNIGAIVYFVRMTGIDTLMTTPLPMAVIGALALASIVRFIYAMAYGD